MSCCISPRAAAQKGSSPRVVPAPPSTLVLLLILAPGGIGGGFQGIVLSPTLLLKTRVMTDPVFRNKMGLAETTRMSAAVGLAVIKKEGASALMKGSMLFSAKRVADWSTRYFFAIHAEHRLFGDDATVSKKFSASLLGGLASTLCTIPLDVLVAQVQQVRRRSSRCHQYCTRLLLLACLRSLSPSLPLSLSLSGKQSWPARLCPRIVRVAVPRGGTDPNHWLLHARFYHARDARRPYYSADEDGNVLRLRMRLKMHAKWRLPRGSK